jgi:hypothetical protein
LSGLTERSVSAWASIGIRTAPAAPSMKAFSKRSSVVSPCVAPWSAPAVPPAIEPISFVAAKPSSDAYFFRVVE